MIKCKCGNEAIWSNKENKYCDKCAKEELKKANANRNNINKLYIEDLFVPLPKEK